MNTIQKIDVTQNPKSNMCFLSILLVILGIASIICGFVCSESFTYKFNGYYATINRELVVIYIASGITFGFFNFALAVIVDACQKYRKSHKD
ncbi:hypothetical protein [uncultured Duncaniella sp.]|uniref:hypothetical protein n=1 Tax=uncultured Duncaniella sp. TaxID=2768039 RepID=UPI00321FCAB3